MAGGPLEGIRCSPRPQTDHPADCALTSVCRLAVVVNRRAAQPALNGQFPIGHNKSELNIC